MKVNWGTGIVIFFIVFITLAVSFIVFSLRQKHDLVDEDYYRKGAVYSVQIAINQRSEIYKDSVKVYIDGDFVHIGLCNSLLQDIDSIRVVFYRPSDKDLDYSFFSKVVDNSSIKVPKSKLANGRYLVKLSWVLLENKYMLQKQLFIY